MDDTERHDELRALIRKQGRAALAAQAAAETCLEVLQSQTTAPEVEAPAVDPAALVKCLLPAFDALQRVAAEARALQSADVSLWSRIAGGSKVQQMSLLDGVQLLERQFMDALASAGVVRDAVVGATLDPLRHRVVEVREPAQAEVSVLEVVRPGYSLAGQRLRETDVVVAAQEKAR